MGPGLRVQRSSDAPPQPSCLNPNPPCQVNPFQPPDLTARSTGARAARKHPPGNVIFLKPFSGFWLRTLSDQELLGVAIGFRGEGNSCSCLNEEGYCLLQNYRHDANVTLL